MESVHLRKKLMAIAVLLLMHKCLLGSLATKDGKTNFGDTVFVSKTDSRSAAYPSKFPLSDHEFF